MATPSLAEVEARMRPGVYSQAGFLNEGERLEEVLAADAAVLVGLELEPDSLAAPLDRLISAAEANRLRFTRERAILLRIAVHRGFQLCPWTADPPNQCTVGAGVSHASVDWQACNLRRLVALSGPGLAVHLIREHGFFGGSGTRFRVDPSALARLLELGR
ncbi:MAG: hypothetical protein ACXVY8_06480 [Gaiellaceae bacterium]